jgi:hypothetical protein
MQLLQYQFNRFDCIVMTDKPYPWGIFAASLKVTLIKCFTVKTKQLLCLAHAGAEQVDGLLAARRGAIVAEFCVLGHGRCR